VLQKGNVVNKGRIFLSKTSNQSVFDAYKNQFQAGFSLFLKCRGVEIVKGGVMVLTFMARRGSDPSAEEDSYMWELLALSLMELVSMVPVYPS
jgi:SAM dependent carboxyl methyltransferase